MAKVDPGTVPAGQAAVRITYSDEDLAGSPDQHGGDSPNVPGPPEEVTKDRAVEACHRAPGLAPYFPVSNLPKAPGSQVGQHSPTAETFREAVHGKCQRALANGAITASPQARTSSATLSGEAPPGLPASRLKCLHSVISSGPGRALQACVLPYGLPGRRLEPHGQWVVDRSDTSHFQAWPFCSLSPRPTHVPHHGHLSHLPRDKAAGWSH